MEKCSDKRHEKCSKTHNYIAKFLQIACYHSAAGVILFCLSKHNYHLGIFGMPDRCIVEFHFICICGNSQEIRRIHIRHQTGQKQKSDSYEIGKESCRNFRLREVNICLNEYKNIFNAKLMTIH